MNRMPEQFGKEFWEERYHGQTSLWSKQPNPQLVAEAGTLTPGTALDIGCGEGADAIWLATRGWHVTAVDLARPALDRGRARAESLGADIATLIDWVEADLTAWTPPPDHFDLVTCHYVHPTGSRRALLERLAAAVSPGGTLLVVDHHPSEERPSGVCSSSADGTVGTGQIIEGLDTDGWDAVVAETRSRSVTDHDGNETTLRDIVLRARKRP